MADSSKEKHLSIKDRIKWKNIGSAKKIIFAAGIVLGVIIIILLVIYYWTFNNYKIEISDTKENTLVYSYYSFDGKILKCASDTASLCDSSNEYYWTITYEMANPKADACGEYAVIYDKGGTSVYICDEKGKAGNYNSELPILKAYITNVGTVALLTDDGSAAQIDYMDTDGSLISTIKTTFSTDGYPMDISVSDDGILLAVSYLRFNQGMTVSDVKFYSFGAAGQTVQDYVVGNFSYENTVIPQLEFMGNKNCVAFSDDRVIAYEAGKTVVEENESYINDEIRSTFVDNDYFGIVLTGNDNHGYEIIIYNKNGTEKKRINTEFNYTSIKAHDGLIMMYNRNSMCIYSRSGVLKYNGQLDAFIRSICFIDANRYALAATDSYNIIRLY